MASYKILAPNSTLGPLGTSVTEEEIAGAGCTAEHLIEQGVVEAQTQPKKLEKE
jgi:hypothetical protein